MLTLNALLESRSFNSYMHKGSIHEFKSSHESVHALVSSQATDGTNSAQWSGDSLTNIGTGDAWWYIPTTVYPYPGVYPQPDGMIPPQPNPFIIPPPEPSIIFTIPFCPPDHDMIFLPRDKMERRRALRQELARLEDPITDMPKRPHRRIELSDEE